VEFLIAIQRWVHSAVSSDLSAYAATGDPRILFAMVPAGIFFGAVHALTPGHSKSVLASYLVGSRLHYLKGIAVAGTLAFVHVGTAVVLSLTAAMLVTRTLGGVGQAPILEYVSRGMLIVIGLWLLVRGFRRREHVHGEGLVVGIVAGLIPCPLTLFAMFLALSRGVPEAGLAFAGAMMGGVALTLCGVAVATILARDRVLDLLSRYGGAAETAMRGLDVAAGALLMVLGTVQIVR
jgi:nickel/cobalt transporter (NicO) family protein